MTIGVATTPHEELEAVRKSVSTRPRGIIISESEYTDAPERQALQTELTQYEASGGRAVFVLNRSLPFPAVDVAASSTRREELLIDPAQLKIMWRLRRLFSGLEQQQALELVLGKLKETQSNAEFLMVISKTTPQGTSLADADDEATLA